MPRIKLTKSAIDTLPVPKVDLVYWDVGLPGFGVKITPKGRKVFIVMYRATGGRLRKYTIGPYGRVTLHQAKIAAQKIFTAKMEGRDPAAEKREARERWLRIEWKICWRHLSHSMSRRTALRRSVADAAPGDKSLLGYQKHS